VYGAVIWAVYPKEETMVRQAISGYFGSQSNLMVGLNARAGCMRECKFMMSVRTEERVEKTAFWNGGARSQVQLDK
jgi:hypothetical protein